ncbi:MAG: ArnT family glycosyltransferase [Acidobacteriaceae bacterium]
MPTHRSNAPTSSSASSRPPRPASSVTKASGSKPSASKPSLQSSAPWLAALAAILGVLFYLQLRHFSPFITDDAFISLRYSERLLQGHGLTWNHLRPVEGYTNLLWVLACAALGGLGLSLPFAAHLLGITCTALGIAAVAAQVFRDYPAKIRFVSALIGCGALVLSGPVDVWALGGLEQPMLAAFIAWAAYFGLRWVSTTRPASRDTLAMGLLLGFAVITRADAALFTAAFYCGAAVADGVRVRSFISRARLLPIPVAFFLGQLLFRRLYYHDWLPNTAYVKVAFTLHRLRTGLKYDFVGVQTEIVFFLLAAIGILALWKAGKQRQIKFLVTITVIWLAYIVVIGGDIFPSVRHFVPALAIVAFLVAGCGLLTLGAPFRFSRPRLAFFLALTALVVVSDHFCTPETWEAQGKSIGLFLHRAFADKHPLLVSDAAGVVPFYADLPVVDPLGLNDYYIAHHKSADRGHGWLGHELAAGKYVLDQRPDIFLFSDFQSDIYFPSDVEIAADPRFKANYQAVRFDTDPPDAIRSIVYLRRIDGPLGIQQTADRETIPAYLATMDGANSVKLVQGRAHLVLPPHGLASFARIPVNAGVWTLAAHGSGAASVHVSPPLPTPAGCDTCLRAEAPTHVNLMVTNNTNQPAVLESLDLTRR